MLVAAAASAQGPVCPRPAPAAAPHLVVFPAEASPSLTAPAEVAQGEAFLVTLSAPAPLEQVQVNFLGRRFAAWTEDAEVRALVAVGLDDPPGTYPLTLSGQDAGGGRLEAVCQVAVRQCSFGEQQLTLPEEMVSPDAATLERISAEKERLISCLASASPQRLWNGGFVRPLPGAMLSGFGVQRVLNGEPRSQHGGVDLRAALGEPVRAAAAGRVLLAQPYYLEGNLVVLDHGLGLATIYCHLSEITVKEGDSVAQGEVVGLAGATGRATGPHLHFGARLGQLRVDPLSLFTLTGAGQ